MGVLSAILICGSLAVAAGFATRLRVHYVALGGFLAATGLVILGYAAWSSLEEGHYDDFGGAMMELASLMGAGLLIVSLGPLVAWLLNLVSGRTPAGPAAMAVAMTAAATALAVSSLIVNVATTAQDRATYEPRGRMGALTLNTPEGVPSAAALQRELPGVQVVQDLRPAWPGWVTVVLAGSVYDFGSLYIGDATLLHHLTGDPSTPYDEGTAVLIGPDKPDESSARLSYRFTVEVGADQEKYIPAIGVHPADSELSAVFLPAEVVRDLGLALLPDRLIAMPVPAAAFPRLQDRFTEPYLERGFQPSTGWWRFVGAMVLLALAAAVGLRRRVLLHSALGTVLGGLAGCVIGLLHSWPATTSADWDPPPRVPFETPWLLIAAVVVAVPLLSPLVAALGTACRRALARR